MVCRRLPLSTRKALPWLTPERPLKPPYASTHSAGARLRAETRAALAAGEHGAALAALEGASAPNLAARERPAVVLEVNLPDLAGYEVARILRADPATERVAVVYVSASYTSDETLSAEGVGDAYLPYPVHADQPLTAVRLELRAGMAGRTRAAPKGSR